MGMKSRGGMLRLLLVLLELIVAIRALPAFMKNAKISTKIVQTRYGRLQGLIVPMEQFRYLKPIEVFLGVPYATPPVQSNRFSPTRAPSPWDGVRISDKMGPVCPQKLPDISNETAALERMPRGRLEYLKRLYPYLKNQSEDCLYLNIYSPTQGTALFVDEDAFNHCFEYINRNLPSKNCTKRLYIALSEIFERVLMM
ncbi:hypothetical protein HHI36_005165, partial [Cryptolaemus montrouzieri]